MFTQTTEYALRAMACLAQHQDQLVATTQLAQWTRVPSNYLAKVLQQLAAAGLVTGRRGVGGGYKLAKNAEETTLFDIVKAVGRIGRIPSPPVPVHADNWTLSPLYIKIDEAIADVIERFEAISLQDLAANPEVGARAVAAHQ